MSPDPTPPRKIATRVQVIFRFPQNLRSKIQLRYFMAGDWPC